MYKKQTGKNLSENIKICDCLYASSFEGLTLLEYIQARTEYCKLTHKNCSECKKMIYVGQMVLTSGLLTLKEAFTTAFKNVKYITFKARRRLLQLVQSLVKKQCDERPTMDKDTVKSLLKLCQSNHERQTVRYAIHKASGLSETQSRKSFGFESMTAHSDRV